MALQPHRRARPRRLPPRQRWRPPSSTATSAEPRSSARRRRGRHPRRALPESADALTWLHHALASRPDRHRRAGRCHRRRPDRGPSPGRRPTAWPPPRSWSSGPGPTARCGSSRSSRAVAPGCSCPPPPSPVAGAARVGYVGVQQLDRAAWSIGTLDIEAEAQATVTAGLAGFGGDYARRAHRLPARRPGRHRRPARRLLRRRRPDARLPHLPGPRRPRHHEQPAVQGHGQRPLPLRLHRPDPGRQGSPRHERLPDQPQHQALRGGVGRVGAQPRDREQRRALQPRLRRRPDRRGAALLPREPRRADPGGRAADRGRLLRRGLRRAPRQRPAAHARRRRRRQAPARCWRERRRARRAAGRPARGQGPAGRGRRPCCRRRAHRRRRLRASATAAATRTSRSPRARSTATSKQIECWKHGSAFSLETGEPESLPATKPVPVYEARVVDGEIEVVVP